MKTITLYTKSGCHLCELAESTLAAIQRRHPFTLLRRDIAEDPADFELYKHDVPVILVNRIEIARHRTLYCPSYLDQNTDESYCGQSGYCATGYFWMTRRLDPAMPRLINGYGYQDVLTTLNSTRVELVADVSVSRQLHFAGIADES